MDDLVRIKAIVAFQIGVDSAEYQRLLSDWIEELCKRPQAKPPVQSEIIRNGIVYVLQSVKGRNYRYVPPAKFIQSKFCIDPEPLREKILAEIRIQTIALTVDKILTQGRSSNEYTEREHI